MGGDSTRVAYNEELMACHGQMVLKVLKKLEEGKDIEMSSRRASDWKRFGKIDWTR